MKKGFNAILGGQFLVFVLGVQNYVFSVRSLIVGTAFAFILLPLLVAQLFGSLIAHIIFKIGREKLKPESMFLFSIISFALFSSMLLVPDRIFSALGEFIVFRVILLLSYLFFSFWIYFGLVSLVYLRNRLDPESYYDLIRATFAGIFVGITYNLVIRTAELALNPYLLNILSVGLIIVSLFRYFLLSSIIGQNSEFDRNQNSEQQGATSKDEFKNTDDYQSKEGTKSIFRNLIIFSVMWVLFMMPVNNPELMSYMSGIAHQWIQYIFILTSIVGIIFGVKVIMLKYLRSDVYATLQSFLPVFTLISIGLFGLYLFYPPGLPIYIVNYCIGIVIFAIVAAISFFEFVTKVEKRNVGYFAFLVFFMQTLHVSLRIIMIERHMPYIWALLLVIAVCLQYWNYHVEYQSFALTRKKRSKSKSSGDTEGLDETIQSEQPSDSSKQQSNSIQIDDKRKEGQR